MLDALFEFGPLLIFVALFWRGCCCGDNCAIAADPFDRTDSSNINTGAPVVWSGDTGNFEISGNSLIANSAGRLKCGTPNTSEVDCVVYAEVYATGDGDQVGVWLNGDGTSNYLAARLTVGSSATLEIIERAGGIDTVLETLSVTAATSTVHDLSLFFDIGNSTVIAQLNGSSTDMLCKGNRPLVEGYNYSGIEAPVVTAFEIVEILSFSFDKLVDGATECHALPTCVAACTDNYEDVAYAGYTGSAEISLFADGTCGGCDTVFNATWAMPQTGRTSGSISFAKSQTDSSVCGTLRQYAVLGSVVCEDGVVTLTCQVCITCGTPVYLARFQATMPEYAFEFDTLYALDLILESGSFCDASGAVMLLEVKS